jgi:type I restriction enzyme S subunit
MTELNKIPKHWQVKKLGEVCQKISLNGIKIKQKDYLNEGKFPVVDQGQELVGGFFNDEKMIVSNEPPYIVFGDHTKVKKYINFKFIAGADGVIVLKPNPILNPKFFYFLIHTVNIPDKGYARHFQYLEKESIPLPPLPEQQLIVSKIEELLSDLENGKQQLLLAQQQLKVYRQSLLKWAFEGKLTNKDVKDGELPKGWKKLTLGDIAIRNSQKALPSEMPKAKFIGMDCIEPNTLKPFKFYDFKEFKSAGNIFKKNQVLYGRMRPYLNKVYKAEVDGACSGEFIILDCLDGFNPDLLKYILHHRDFVSFANHKTSGDRPRISFEEIADYPVNVCNPEEQQLIVDELESKLTVCDKIEETISQSLQQAETLKQSILKKAFEGRLV